jgi:cell division protein FtsB
MRRIIALALAAALAVLGVTAWVAGGADATR